jgi:putative transposase
MRASDVTDTIEMALEASGLEERSKAHRPRLLSDSGSSCIAGDLARWLDDQGTGHVRGAPNHPQTQGKIERWQQTLKNRILLENYYLPGGLEAQIGDFVSRYNHRRYHESLGNLTPADVSSGRGHTILMKREAIKQRTFEQRRLQHARRAA